ncbi:MAG TPA: hypothetical protein VKS79_18885 [Gemmataceae bacterium]|nr:hypothetical protein [Gemmataceae bacterium]
MKHLSPFLLIFVIGCAPQLDQDKSKSQRGESSSSVPAQPLDREKEQFLQIVRDNAEDPTDLRITHWGKREPCAPLYLLAGTVMVKEYRVVTFRCRLISGRDSVMVDDATAFYDEKGDIRVLELHKVSPPHWSKK